MIESGHIEALDVIQESLGIAARRAKDARLQEAVGRRAGYAIEGPLFSTLTSLGRGDSCSVSELAERCGLELSTVSRRVRTLEERGLVRRWSPQGDRRTSLLELTVEGQRQYEALTGTWHAMLAEVTADWTPAEVESLAVLFQRFAWGVERYAVHVLGLPALSPHVIAAAEQPG